MYMNIHVYKNGGRWYDDDALTASYCELMHTCIRPNLGYTGHWLALAC